MEKDFLFLPLINVFRLTCLSSLWEVCADRNQPNLHFLPTLQASPPLISVHSAVWKIPKKDDEDNAKHKHNTREWKKDNYLLTSLLCWQAKRPQINLTIIQKLNDKNTGEVWFKRNNKRFNNNLCGPFSLSGGGYDFFSSFFTKNTNSRRQRSPESQGEIWEWKSHSVLHWLRDTASE